MHVLPNPKPGPQGHDANGMAGGYTLSLPDEETQLVTKDKFREQLVALGGAWRKSARFGDVQQGPAMTSGASPP